MTLLIISFALWNEMRFPTVLSMVISGIVLLVAGLIIFISDLFESWLSHSQAALVDGLQAG